MIGISKAEQIKNLKQKYVAGTRVRLEYMDDKYAPEVGTEGTVEFVDDVGTIHVSWDNGCRLGIAYGIDSCSIVEPGLKRFFLKAYSTAIVESEETFEIDAKDLDEAQRILTKRLNRNEVDATWKYMGLEPSTYEYTFEQMKQAQTIERRSNG